MLCANLGGRRQARSVAPKNKNMGQARWGKSQIPHRAGLRALSSLHISHTSLGCEVAAAALWARLHQVGGG